MSQNISAQLNVVQLDRDMIIRSNVSDMDPQDPGKVPRSAPRATHALLCNNVSPSTVES